MPRSRRIQEPETIYHVGSRAVDRRRIFGLLRGDQAVFLGALGRVVERYAWRCYGYCLMPNHFHLVLETPLANIAAGMQLLKSDYARWFNAQVEREGALFERRYWDRTAPLEADSLAVVRYVVLNAVRARLVEHPEDWQWSSYAASVGLVGAPAFLDVDGLLEWFGGTATGRVRLAQFVGEELPKARAAAALRATAGV